MKDACVSQVIVDRKSGAGGTCRTQQNAVDEQAAAVTVVATILPLRLNRG